MKTTQAMKVLHRQLPPIFLLNRRCAFRTDYSYIVVGCSAERTPYKETWYFRRFILPLFRNPGFVRLGYSPRLPDPTNNTTDYFYGTDTDVISKMYEAVKLSGVLDYNATQEFAWFLDLFPPTDIERRPKGYAFDWGCIAGLQGDLEFAQRCFVAEESGYAPSYIARGLSEHDLRFHAEIAAASTACANGHAALTAHLQAKCAETAAALGFKRTDTPTPLPA